MDHLEFDPHVLLQMGRRELPTDAVYHVIGDYDDRIDRRDGVSEYFGTWEGRDLLVVVRWYDEDAGDGLVITAIDTNTRKRKRR